MRDALLADFCSSRGIPYRTGAVSNQISHMKTRMASLSLEPQLHPQPGDRMLPLALQTCRLAWHDKGASLSKRVFASIWTLALLLAPRRWKRPIVEFAMVPTSRHGFLARLMQAQPLKTAPVPTPNQF